MTQLAEAYFHLKQTTINQQRLIELGDLAANLAAEAARGLFHPDSIIEVRLSEGSLKGWITLGAVITLYGAIADYKGFKESIFEITSDAKKFGEIVINEFVSKSDLAGAKVYRKERRTKTPGKIKN